MHSVQTRHDTTRDSVGEPLPRFDVMGSYQCNDFIGTLHLLVRIDSSCLLQINDNATNCSHQQQCLEQLNVTL